MINLQLHQLPTCQLLLFLHCHHQHQQQADQVGTVTTGPPAHNQWPPATSTPAYHQWPGSHPTQSTRAHTAGRQDIGPHMAMVVRKGGTTTGTLASAMAMVASRRRWCPAVIVDTSTPSIIATSTIHHLRAVHTTIIANMEVNRITSRNRNHHHPTWITTPSITHPSLRSHTIERGTPIPLRPVTPITQRRLKQDLRGSMGSEGEFSVSCSPVCSQSCIPHTTSFVVVILSYIYEYAQ